MCTFKGLVRWERGVCWKQLPFGPFKFPNSSAASDLDRLWPQRVAVFQAFDPSSKGLLGTVHVAGVAAFGGALRAGFSVLT